MSAQKGLKTSILLHALLSPLNDSIKQAFSSHLTILEVEDASRVQHKPNRVQRSEGPFVRFPSAVAAPTSPLDHVRIMLSGKDPNPTPAIKPLKANAGALLLRKHHAT